MKKSIRHSGVLMMLGVFAIALMGSAYTLWYENLEFQADIETGTLNLNWSVEGDTDIGTYTGTPVAAVLTEGESVTASDFFASNTNTSVTGSTVDEPPVPEGKPLPTCTAEISNGADDTANDNPTSNVLNLDLLGLYPYAGCVFDINITNAGSVPVHLSLENISDNTNNEAEVTWELVNDLSDTGLEHCQSLLDQIFGAETGELTDANGDPIQLHQNDTIRCEVIYYLKQTNDDGSTTSENFSGSFSYTIVGHQWNETPSGVPGS